MTATIHKFDVQPEGSFELDMTGPDGIPHGAFGKFVEVVPGHRIVQTWRWKDFPIDSGESRLTIELREVSGGTELILTLERLADTTSVKEHTKGWTSSLEQLGKIL
jgi:uncharacterized protein YndB with AHSA1/START domain